MSPLVFQYQGCYLFSHFRQKIDKYWIFEKKKPSYKVTQGFDRAHCRIDVVIDKNLSLASKILIEGFLEESGGNIKD